MDHSTLFTHQNDSFHGNETICCRELEIEKKWQFSKTESYVSNKDPMQRFQ